MNKNLIRSIVRTIILVVSIFTILLTLYTVGIGAELAFISEQNINSETWRISNSGSVAANNVYEENAEIRREIYNSPCKYKSWISTSNNGVQLLVGLSLLLISSFSAWYIYIYIIYKIKRFRRKLRKLQIFTTRPAVR